MTLLTNIKSGKTVELISIEGGFCMEKRLSELGLLPGEKINILSNFGVGHIMIIVKGSKLALGRGLAEKLLVKEI